MIEEQNGPEFEQLAAQLRVTASSTNEVFDLARPRRWRAALRSRLRRLNQLLSAADAQLFRVSRPKNSDQTVRLLSGVAKRTPAEGGISSGRFAFRLLPSEIQEGLESQTVIKISTENGTGGRLFQHMRSGVEGKEAIIVPMCRRNGRLSGMLVLFSTENPFRELTGSQVARLTELLRLNGSLLLSNVQRQKKLTRQERDLKQWRQIADCACDFALQTNDQLLITEVIPFGSSTSCPPARGLRLTDIVERTFHRRLKQQMALALKDGKVRTVEFRLTLGAEPATWYHVRIEPRVDSSNGECMLYLTDNNQDKRLQSEINLLNEQLVRASRLSLLGQMSTEFAHQLNQPLQAILFVSDLTLSRIKKGKDTPEGTLKALQQIETSVTHASNIIESIRDFARYRALKVERVGLASLLDDAIMMVTERASRLNGEFVVLDLPDVCEVMADRTQSTHVFINLFVNALEATSEFGVDHPLISIFIEDVGKTNRVVVAVKDNGPGLPNENPDQVFEKFHTQKEDGLGLGLAISRDVCEAQQGSLNAVNNTGEPGCTFFVGFRAAKEDRDFISDDEDTI